MFRPVTAHMKPRMNSGAIVAPERHARWTEHRLCLSPAYVFTAKRIFVNVTKVSQVQQVVVDKLVVGVIVKFAGLHRIIWILVPESARDQCGIGARGLAHPYPDPAVLLHNRERADGDAFRNPVAAGYFHTLARGREFEAVIHAAYIIAFKPAARQRREPVAAAVLQYCDRAVRGAIENNRFPDDGPSDDLALGHLVAPSCYVPKIS